MPDKKPARKIGRITTDRIPQRFVAVSTTPRPRRVSDNVSALGLSCFAAVSMVLQKDGSYKPDTTACGINPSLFWSWLRDIAPAKTRLHIFARNVIADLTLLGFWRMVETGSAVLSASVLGDPPTIISFAGGGKKFKVVDILNIYNCPAEELMPTRFYDAWANLAVDCKNIVGKPDAAAWCHSTAEAIADHLETIARDKLGGFRPTAAGQAWALWRRRYRGPKVEPHGDPEVQELERAAFYGGRNQCFYRGKVEDRAGWLSQPLGTLPTTIPELGPVYEIDIRSAYVFAMMSTRYPVKLLLKSTAFNPYQLGEVWSKPGRTAIAAVKLETESAVYPCRVDGRTVYPVGTFWTTLAGPELQQAAAAGIIKDVGRVAVYQTADLFTPLMQEICQARKTARDAGSKAKERLYKLLGNSLFGRFARWDQEWIKCRCRVSPGGWGVKYLAWGDGCAACKFRVLGDYLECYAGKCEAKDTLVAVAACIAAEARRHLHLVCATASRGKVYYCDTDCIHCDQTAYDAIGMQSHLAVDFPGSLRVVSINDTAEYYGQKRYKLGDKLVCAGLNLEHTSVNDKTKTVCHLEGIAGLLARDPSNEIMSTLLPFDPTKPKHHDAYDSLGWLVPPRLGLGKEPKTFEG